MSTSQSFTAGNEHDAHMHEAPERITLEFSCPQLRAEVPPSLTLSASAESAIASLPAPVQRELVRLIESDDSPPCPGFPDLFVAQSPDGYRITYTREDKRKKAMHVFTPAQLALLQHEAGR